MIQYREIDSGASKVKATFPKTDYYFRDYSHDLKI